MKYFAYGSNMDLQGIKARGVNVYDFEVGMLDNWQLVVNVIDDDLVGAGFANIMPQANARVEGVIYTIDEVSILSLDHYENYPFDYTREVIRVQRANYEPVDCMVYIGQTARLRDGLKPTKSYWRSLLHGRPFLSQSYYDRLCKIDTFD
ncbi:MAG: gamma-glutamylcyclotransferase family protein [Pseudanabaenaceae cyanobacterium bins.39]|nr:gamma-glutamylcyclotransferase family protein [Pseudanabaenaceae cyanobacterium bins.39]